MVALLANKRPGWLQKGREISILIVEYTRKKFESILQLANAYILVKHEQQVSPNPLNIETDCSACRIDYF